MERPENRTTTTLRRLEALQASGVLSPAEVVSCTGLAEALRRPARVAILGLSASDVTGVLHAMLGEGPIAVQPEGPALEIAYGDDMRHKVTFEDGSTMAQDGYPDHGVLSLGPLFVQVEARMDILRTMSFLALELGAEPAEYTPALGWSAKRAEIAIFCAPGFGDAEAAIWAAAPDRLKNHCYLVVTGAADTGSARARGLFDAVIHAPGAGPGAATLAVLRHRLSTDITEARAEDVDAAELFLRRFPAGADAGTDGVPAPASTPKPDAAGTGATASEAAPARSPEVSPEPSAATRKLVSAPILHLKKRSRALAEMLEWREEAEEWSGEVLEHCAATAEALRDLVAAWPDDDPLAEKLREAVDQACDTVVLLQMEAGPEQAEDAARVLFQLRNDFEQAMAA